MGVPGSVLEGQFAPALGDIYKDSCRHKCRGERECSEEFAVQNSCMSESSSIDPERTNNDNPEYTTEQDCDKHWQLGRGRQYYTVVFSIE
jgi:hypothetical protein